MFDVINPGSGPVAKAFTLPISRRPGAGSGYCTTRRECALPPQGSRGTEMNCSSEEPGGSAAGLPPGCVMSRLSASGPHRSSLWRRLRPRENAATLLRGARACLALLAALAVLALGVPGEAQAQTVTTFISNTGQSGVDTFNQLRATSFTTGAAVTLTSVGLGNATVGNLVTPLVQIYENSGANAPGTLLATLDNPGTITNNAVNTFTAQANTLLRANTTYWLAASNNNAPGYFVWTVNSTTVDSAATGWSIGNALSRTNTASAWVSSTNRLRFQIRGTIATANAAPTVANPIDDQTATAGTALDYAFPANTFADTDVGDTLTYTAIQSDDSALPAWLSFTAATRTFSGTPAAADVETVSVKVTASDGTDSVSDTFDIVVSADTTTAMTVEVPADWALKPADIRPGERFRLIFASSTTRDAISTDIADYNTFITTRAAAGVAAIQPYADDFTALVSTETVNARANTLTGSTDTDAPIYWVQPAGTVASTHRAADDYAAFYGGTWASGAEGTDESGTRVYLGIIRFWTGTNSDGTTAATGFMGTSASPPSVISWTVSFTTAVQIRNTVSSRTQRIVGLSPVFQVAAAPAVAPGIPTGLTAIASGHSQINLTWTAPDNNGGAVITGYKIEVSTDGSSDWTDLVADTGSTAITYAHTGLTAATTRHYRVSAINEIGASNPSVSDDATTTEVDAAPMGEVPGDWALKPADIGAGEQFRLMFFGGPGRDATSASIADYNTYVRTSAAAGVTAIQPYAEDFTALVSTQTVNVRTNTLTRATDTDVPIYWVRSGTVAADDRVADDYAGFYDGSWATGTNAYDQDGVLRRLSSAGAWTGSNTDGTTHRTGYMGAPLAIYWAVISGDVISSHLDTSGLGNRIAALSPVFQVSTTPFNTAPTGTDKTVATAQDTAYAFMAGDFGFADTDTDDTLDSVKIVTPPASGTLALDGTEVMADDVVTTTQLDAGDLIFTPVAGASGDPYTSFTFKVNDGTDDSVDAYTMSIAVNAAPTAADNTVATAQDTAYAFMAVDFGFADTDTGDTLDSVKIVTPPALGTLALDGTAVMADDVVTRAQIDGDMLTFTPVAGASGDPYTSFTFKVNDGTDDSAADYTMSITVNTAPTAANNTVAMARNTAYAFMADDFGFADDDAGDTLDSVKIVTPPALGTLALDGTAVMADGVVTTAQLDAGDLTFTPVPGATGDPYTSFTFKVNDGTDDSASDYTMSIAVSAAPTGADKTVETARNTAYAFMADDFGFEDDDAGDTLESVKIITPPASGTLALDGTEVMADAVVTTAQLDAGELTFTPVAGATGKPYTSFTFKVNDGTLDSAAAYTMSIAVNTAPTGADNTVATAQNTAYAFMAGDFGFADTDTGDTLDSVKIVTPPGLGTLALDGTEVMADAVVTRAQIDGDMLTFTPVAGASGDPYTSFTFKVNDGTEDSASAYTMSIAVNTAPTGADNTVTMAADRSYTFVADEFGFADTDAGDTLDSVRIVTLPALGTLAFDGGTAVMADDVVTKAQLDHRFTQLTFTPAAGASGDPYTSFTFKVNDGTDDSAAAYTMSITVSAIGAVSTAEVPHNWALKPADIGAGEQFRLIFHAWGIPATSANIATYNNHVRSEAGKGVTALRSYADDFRALVSTQAVNVRANTMTRATDTDVPIYWVRSDPVAADDRVAADYADFYDGSWATGGTSYNHLGLSLDLDTHVTWTGSNANGTTHSTGYMGASSDIAYWRVSSSGGITVLNDVQPSSNLAIFALSPVFQVSTDNTAPTGANNTVTTGEDRGYTFTADDFEFNDADADDTLDSVRVVTPPASGTLALDGTEVMADDVVTKAQLDDGDLIFTPVAGATGDPYTTFTFKVNDGTDDSAAAYTMSITVSAARTVSPAEVPGDWALKPADIAAGGQFRLMFQSSAGLVATSTDIAVYDTWVRTHAAAGVTAIQPYAEDFTALVSTQTVNARTNTLTRATDTDVPIYWVRSGPVAADDRVADDYADFYDGLWATGGDRYSEVGGFNLLSAAITWTGSNPNGTTHSTGYMGSSPDVAHWTVSSSGAVQAYLSRSSDNYGILGLSSVFQVATTLVNTAPTGADNTVATAQNTAYAFAAADFGFADTDLADGLNSVRIVTPPALGMLALDGTDVMADDIVTKAQLDDGELTYTPVPGATGAPYASFTFKVNDGRDDSASAYTMSITVNTAPTAANNTVAMAQNTAYAFMAGDFGFADTDTGDTLDSVKIVTPPALGTLALDGTEVMADDVVTKAQLDAGDLTFTPVAGATGDPYTSFTFKVNDGTVDSASAYTMTIDVRDLSCAAPDFAGDNRRELWTGIVTAGDIVSVGYGFRSDLSQTGLDDTTFAIGRNDYTVDAAFVVSINPLAGDLRFSLTGDEQNPLTAGEVAALRLHVCDTVFYDFSAANSSGNENTYRWAGSLDWSPPVATRTLYLSLPANRNAMGAPAITGTAQVGQDLTADVAGITDADGLTGDLSTLIDNIDGLGGVEYSYQWIRVDADGSSNEEDISGEIAATYTLTDADAGKKVKVKVSFTDDLNGEEVRTSEAFPSSGTVMGTTNNAPVFDPAMPEREIAENTAAGVNVGAAVTATDADAGDTLSYTLGGADVASFDFVETTGQIRTKSGVTYDHEAKASYTVTVTASDGTSTAAASVTISVTDVDEPPSAPATPMVSAVSGSTTSLSVSWAAPANDGKPAIASYDVQYRVGSSGTWSDGPVDVTGTSTTTTITSLVANTDYEARVRATNAEGDSGWSDPPGSGRTNGPSNNAPVFDPAMPEREIAENTAAGVNVGAAVTATDADAGDTLSYTLGGADVASFDFVETTGQIRTKSGVTYDHEAKASYTVTVTASDGTSTAAASVTISVTDVDEPPSAPATPMVSAVSGSSTSLSVSWAAPANAGKPAIASYDVQYRAGTSGSWSDGPENVTTTTAIVTGLVVDTLYQARVRATNAEGDSGWSDPPGSGRTNAPGTSAPGAPRDLRTTPGDGRVTLAWTAPGSDGGAAIEKYRYRVSANAGSSWDPDWTDVPDGADVGDSAADETTFTVSGLINGTEYVFQLRAVNSVGEGLAASDAATPVRAPLPPGSGFLVGNFGQTADGAAQISVTQDIVGVFTTGARGAELHNIELRLFTRRPNIAVLPIPSVTLYRASVTDSRATRGARVAALTAVAGSRQPANTAQTVAFAAPSGTRLDAGATYLVVLEHTSYVRVESTTFPAEDAGGAPGWAIDGIGAGNSSPYSYGTTASLLMRVNGAAANTAPMAANNTVTAVAGTAYAFEADDFGFADTDTGDTLASVKIVTLPAVGTLALAGTAVTLNEVVTKAQIDDGDLTFTPVDGASGTGYATFTFKVNDGTVDSASAYTMTIDARDLSCAVPDFAGDNRHQLWTGIVTAGDIVSVGYGFRSDLSQTGLDDTTFAIGRNDYTVDAAYVVSINPLAGDLRFSLTGDEQNPLTAGEVAALRLHVCDTVFYDFSAANSSGNENTYRWAGSLDWSPPVATRTLYLSLPSNRDAMGAPAITGTAQVGQDLTADVAGITDADGLTGDLSTLIDNIDGRGGVEYSYQWLRVDADGSSNEEDISGEIAATYTLTDADAGKKVKVKVSFTDDLNGEEERTSEAFPSSGTVMGTTNNAPVFDPAMPEREIAENTAAGVNVGAAVTATDADAGDTLSYTLGGADVASFDFVETTGQIRTKSGVTYDHEAKASYTVTVTASDGTSTAAASVTISVTDVDEPPSAPATPMVSAVSGSSTSLSVSWAAPANAGKPAIASYDVQYRVGSSGTWSDGPVDVTGTSTTTTITSLVANTDYEARVRATNAEGDSGWSDPPGSGRTNGPSNNAPVFDPAMPEREIAENTAAGVNVGAVVTATDADAGDTLSYTLGGADVASFDFVETTGQIRTKSGVTYDHEAKASYTVTVTASDGTSTAAASVTISVTDVDEPPSAPATPMVSAVSGSSTSLSVSWAAPANAGKPAIASYDVQYRVGSSGAWSDGPVDVTGTSTTTTITSLVANTDYEARVRATNAEGDSGWSSPPGSGRTNAPGTSAPGAPRDLRTTPGDGRVTLAWTAPGSDGGAAIEKYRYRVSANAGSSWDPDWTDVPDGADVGDSAADETTFTVSGLINGTEYVFQLRAVNSVGEGLAASDAATPVRAPLPPGSGFLVGNFGQTADGAAQIYVTQDIVGVFTTGARGAELHNIELRLFTRRPDSAQLPSATLYRASVTDTRAATRGDPVAALTAVPGSPRPSATAQTVAFIAPGGTRLEADAKYLVVLEELSYVRVESTTFPAEDAGGAPGWAIDGIGAGNSSPYSYGTTASLLMRVNGTAAGATVATAPEAPASLGARAGDAEVTLRWTPPRSDGRAGIEKYQVRYSAGSRVDPDTAWSDVPDGSDSGTSRADERSVSVTELDNGRQYAFELRAVNSVRAGAAATATATPARRTGFLVSNFGQPVDGSSQISVTQDIVGAFTAGALGATLDSIELRLYSRTPDIAQLPSATLYRGSVTATRATPGTRVATLTAAPGSPRPAASAQTIVFTAPGGTRLDAGATYLVVLAGSGFVRVESTNSSAQDAGGASGWTIDGVGAGNSSPYSYGTSDSLLMSVNGTTARAQRAVREKAAKDEQQGEEQEPAMSPDPDRGISLSTSSSSAIEGQAVTISVRRAGPTDRATTVTVQVLDSALDGAWPMDLVFRSGAATATAAVAIGFDGARPASRTVTVSLASVKEPYSVGSPSTLTFNVTDRDAALSVADASVSEGPGARLAFAVTLDRTRDRKVLVRYATADGTATQGEDYTGVSGTLRFAPGETTKTVSVPVLDDAHDEGSETLTLTLTSPRRAVIDDGTAVGTIVNSDPLPNAWLSRFGRAASDHVVQSIGRRLEGGARESHLTVMGWRVDTLLQSTHPERDGREPRADAPGRQPEGSVRASEGWTGGATRGGGAMSDPGAARPAFEGAMTQGVPPMQGGALQSSARAVGASDNRWLDMLGRLFMALGPNGGEALATPGLRDMVMGSSFYYGYSPDAGTLRSMNRLTAWGESAATRFSGAEGKLSLDGEVNTAIVGADGEWGRWLAGLALSYSEGEGGYRRVSAKGGAVSSTLAGINPYARYRLDERTSFWATLGYGSGRLILTPDGAESALETDMTNAMAAFGGRGVLSMRAGKTGQFELALRSDAMLTDTASMAVAGLSSGAGATSRIRLILEGSGSLPAFGGVLAPKVEAGLRYDGGDAETGAGLEVGGGLAYGKARLTVQVDGRVLLTHRDRDYEEWGYSLSLVYQPSEDGRGLRYQSGSQWGATQSGVQSLWSLQNAGGLANGARTANGQRYTAELGYGFGVVGRLWYPYVATESGGASSQALRFGLKFNAGSALEAGLEIGRRAHLSGEMENEIRLRWQARW